MTPADAGSRPARLAPKIVNEVHELHRRNVELARDAAGRRSRRNRRERRDARLAESDLLRVLGFESYEAFQAHAAEANDGDNDEIDVVEKASPTLSLVDGPSSNTEDEAQQTEAALLRVLRAGVPTAAGTRPHDEGDVDAGGPPRGAEPGSIDEFRTRVALFEEELAETRFELLTLRDRVRDVVREAAAEADADPAQDDTVDGAVPAAAAALIQVAAELRGLCETLREERAVVAALGADARAEAQRILERARLDARQLSDEAATHARAVLDRAGADALALTRNAISTVDGLRRLADESAVVGERGPGLPA